MTVHRPRISCGTDRAEPLRAICPYIKAGRYPVWVRVILLLGYLGCFVPGSAAALNPDTRLSQYGHAVWRVQEGYLDGYPTAFAQTPDGYLWVGTPAGLYRFDGVSFTALEPPSRKVSTASVYSLYAARDGSLWVGFAGWLSHWDGEKFAPRIVTLGYPTSIVEDQDGAIWFSRAAQSDNSGPICKVSLDKFHCYGEAEGIQPLGASAIKIGEQGHFWIAAGVTLVEWNGKLVREYSLTGLNPLTGLKKFSSNSAVTALAVDAGGTVWTAVAGFSSGSQLQRFVNGKWEPYTVPGWKTASFLISYLFFDREGCLWVGTGSDGLYRIHGDSVDHYGRADGLSSDDVTGIFQDREGSVWIATSEGVDHFYDMPVVSYSNKQGLGGPDAESVLGRRDGSIAVMSVGSIYSIRGSTITPLFEHSSQHSAMLGLLEDHNGDLWFGTSNGGLMVKSKGGLRTVVKGDRTGGFIALAEDTDHNVWAVFSGRHPRLIRIENGQVREEFDPPQVPAAYTVIADPHQGIWLSGFGKQLMHYKQGEWQSLQLDSLLKRYGSIAAIFNMTFDANGTLWGSNSWGVIAYRNGKLQLLNDRNGLPCKSTASVLFDRHNDLWL